MVIHVAQKEAGIGLVNNQPDIAANPNRPEVLVLGPINFVKLQTRVGGIHLQVESGGLHRLLLIDRKPG